MLGHRCLWAVALASIFIFQIGSFGITISPSSISITESLLQDSAFDSVSNIALQSEEVEVQQMISCLQVPKPNCEPTLNETSEFLWGKISMEIILPENTHPMSTEKWEDDELKQIMKMFGLRTIIGRPDITLSPIEESLAGSGLFPILDPPPFVGPLFTFAADTGLKFEELEGVVVGLRYFGANIGTNTIEYLGEADIVLDTGEQITREVGFTMRVSARVIEQAVVEAAIQTLSDGAIIEAHPPAPPLSGETPILTTAEPARIWINAVMNEVEGGKFKDTKDNFIQQVKKYANHIRERDGSDWAFVAFIVDASNDEDGLFADGVGAWSELGGPFMVLSNRLGGYGFANFDRIFLHEFLHQFYALDEYQGSFFDQNGVSGYLGIRNENHENATGGSFTGDPSIMKRLQLVLDPNDFITERDPGSPACPGHWTTDPDCEVQVNGMKIGATYDVDPAPCQPARSLTRACFKVDWHNDQNFNGPAPFFWFHSITVDPQGPLKPGETYRFGRYYLVNPIGTSFPLGRAAIEVYTDNGTLIASHDLNRTTQFDTNGNAIFEFQSVEFTIPNGTNRIDIFFTRCFADPNESCSIVAYDDFTLIGDWVFRNAIDEFALKMLGFNDEDQDGLIDPVDTVPGVKLDTFFPQPVLIQAKLTDLNTCQLTIGSETFAFSSWELEDVGNVRFSQLDPCRTTVSFDLTGPNPTATAFFERIGGGPCPPPCIPPTPTQNSDEVLVTQDNDSAVPLVVQPPSLNALLKIQASDFTNPINGVPVEVSPSDLNGAGNGLTPFTRLYAHTAYNIGTTLTGWSYDIPEENMNPLGSHNSITINEISSVEYCVHGQIPACFVMTNPTDGAFDEAGEGFEIPPLPPGLQTLSIIAENSVKNRSNIFTMNFLVLPAECSGKTFSKIIVGTPQNDLLLGTFRADLILGLEGDDELRGRGSTDCLLGGDGNDIIYGNRGGDAILGDEGDDTLLGGLGNDKLDGGDDFDTCKGGAGTNTKKNCEA